MYHEEHTCAESVHLQAKSAHSLLEDLQGHIFEAVPPATSESLVTYDAVSSNTAGTLFRFPAMSTDSQVTHEGASRSTAGVQFMSPGPLESLVTSDAVSSSTAGTRFRFPAMSAGSQVTHEGVSRSTAGVRLMSPGASESQVTDFSISMAGFWSGPDELDSATNSTINNRLDLNADFVDLDDTDCSE